MIHTAQYARNTATGAWRARCTACQWWERFGTEEFVTGQFAVHDIGQWEAVETPAPQPAVPA